MNKIIETTTFKDKNGKFLKEYDIVKCYPWETNSFPRIEIGILLKDENNNGIWNFIYRLDSCWYGKNKLSSQSYGKWAYVIYDYKEEVDSKYIEIIGNALVDDINQFIQ